MIFPLISSFLCLNIYHRKDDFTGFLSVALDAVGMSSDFHLMTVFYLS